MTEEEFATALETLQTRLQDKGLSEEEMQETQQKLNDLYRSTGGPPAQSSGLRRRLRRRRPAVRGKESSVTHIVQRHLGC